MGRTSSRLSPFLWRWLRATKVLVKSAAVDSIVEKREEKRVESSLSSLDRPRVGR